MRKKTIRLMALVCAVCLLIPAAALARTPYRTFTVNGYGELQETQTAYTVQRVITRFDGGGRNDVVFAQAARDLRGLFVGEDGRIYLTYADRRRVYIHVAENDGTLVGSITAPELAFPNDVYVAPNGHIYVADPEARIAAGQGWVISLSPAAPEKPDLPEAPEQREETAGPVFGNPELTFDPDTGLITLTIAVTPAEGEAAEDEQFFFERAAAPETGGDASASAAGEDAADGRDILIGAWTSGDCALTLAADSYELSLPGLGYASAGAWNARSSAITMIGAVFEFDETYALVHTYVKPDNPLYGASTPFRPLKVVVNHAGILYVICDGNANGIVEISPGEDGEEDAFLGYFGTNYATVGVWDLFLRMIRTAEQRSMSGNSTNPRSPTNLDLDERGLVYTVTQGDGPRTLKRLNIAGSNLIGPAQVIDKPAGIAAGLDNNVYVADEDGFIYEFNNDGELLFIFGGKDDGTSRAGLFRKVTAIDVGPDGRLYVLDSSQRAITVFEPTEFTVALHEALTDYANGRYEESMGPLRTVLDMNSMFDAANRAMGRAYYQVEDYDQALHYARLARDTDGYSDAFWEVRNIWLKRNIATVFIVVIAAAVIWWALKLIDRRKPFLKKLRPNLHLTERSKYLSDLRYSFYYMRHPIDGSYGIAREGRASWAVSLTLLLLFIAEFIINRYFCGFLQKTVHDGRYEFFSDAGMLLAAAVGLVGCNYLVCTINEGEGTVKKIGSYFCYSLTPYILLTPVVFVLSLVLTKNEQFLITLVQILTWSWVAVLLVLGIREVNNYTGKQTVKIILLTLFTVLILALIVFVLYILWAQVFKFIGEIFGEVVYRVG